MRLPLMIVPLVALSLAGPALAQTPTPVYGGATPQETIDGLKKASAANDFGGAMKFISPAGRKEMSKDMVSGLMMMVNMSDPSDPMPGSPKPSASELAKQKKDYASAVSMIKAALKPHGLDTMIGKPPMNEATQAAIDAALTKTDTVVLITSVMSTLDKAGPLLGMKKDEGPNKVPFEIGAVTGYKITGDKATAQNGKETLEFVKIDGRWYLSPPKGK